MIEYRWARGKYDQLPAHALELVGRPVAVIAATRGPAPARAAKAASMPIVFQSGTNPINDGPVDSLGRPGGETSPVRPLSTDLIPKRLGLMSELVPKMTAIALLPNPLSPQAEVRAREMQLGDGL